MIATLSPAFTPASFSRFATEVAIHQIHCSSSGLFPCLLRVCIQNTVLTKSFNACHQHLVQCAGLLPQVLPIVGRRAVGPMPSSLLPCTPSVVIST